MNWTLTTESLPPTSKMVLTKVDDGTNSPTKLEKLRYENEAWVYPNRKGIVDWTPTHWKTEQ